MANTFMRGLEVVQYVDLFGPVGISDLARGFGVDKGNMSRLVSAAEADGWLRRTDDGVVIGPRTALLGDVDPLSRGIQDAALLLGTVSSLVGMVCQALVLAGDRAVAFASSRPAEFGADDYRRRTRFPLWAGAAGKVIAAQLESEDLDRLLPAEPYPAPETINIEWTDDQMRRDLLPPHPRPAPAVGEQTTRIETRRALNEQLSQIRREGGFRELRELHAELGCISVPWTAFPVPAAVSCVGPVGEIEARASVITAALTAAAARGATRETIIRAVTGALS